MSFGKRILVCPLNWGLGHATRCIPIIKELQRHGATPILAAEGGPLELLRTAFPDLQSVEFTGYDITYPRQGSMALHMLRQMPKMLQRIRWENQELEKLISELKVDAVISDNRFGLASASVPSVYISHQIHIQAAALKGQLYKAHRKYIEQYDECWIPDYETSPGLAGDLSHHQEMPNNIHYVGPLSRFEVKTEQAIDDSVLIILSGPEPARTQLEEAINLQLPDLSMPVNIVRGRPGEKAGNDHADNVKWHPHLSTDAMTPLLQKASAVVSRPGYSTLMDLSVFGKKALFIPTPGQTEQEYLAQKVFEQGWVNTQKQSQLRLVEGLEEAQLRSGLPRRENGNLLAKTIERWITSF